MNVYTVMHWLLKLTEILANLFIMGIPIKVVMALDRHRKDRRSGRYYWLAFAIVVAVYMLMFTAIPARFISPKSAPQGLAKLAAILANLFVVGIPIMIFMALDRYRKDWRGGRYYLLAFAIAVVAQLVILGIPYYALMKSNTQT